MQYVQTQADTAGMAAIHVHYLTGSSYAGIKLQGTGIGYCLSMQVSPCSIYIFKSSTHV